MSGTSVVSGLSSGIDWRDILDQLRAVEYKRVELVQDRKKTYEDRLSAWQSINTKLLAFKTAAGTVNKATSFNIYAPSLSSNTATAAEDILSATANGRRPRDLPDHGQRKGECAETLNDHVCQSDDVAQSLRRSRCRRPDRQHHGQRYAGRSSRQAERSQYRDGSLGSHSLHYQVRGHRLQAGPDE